MFYIGIDGGGTRCRARLESADGVLIAEGVSGSANVMRCLPTARTSIIDACRKAVAASGLTIPDNQICVGAGLAGANVPTALEAIQQWQHPFAAFEVISDLHAACYGAHDGADGAVIICGTGSSGTRLQNHKFTDVGGHGFQIGDIASGAWLGLQAVQHTLQVLDGLRPHDGLSGALISHTQCQNGIELVQYCASFKPKDYASLAPIIVELVPQQDATAVALLERAVSYLQCLADRLVENTTLPLSLIGGLSHIYKPYFGADTQKHLIACAKSPEQGAIRYIKQFQCEEIGA